MPPGQENKWVFLRDSRAGRKVGENSSFGGSGLFSQISEDLRKVKGLKQLDSYSAGLSSRRSRTVLCGGGDRSRTWSSFTEGQILLGQQECLGL